MRKVLIPSRDVINPRCIGEGACILAVILLGYRLCLVVYAAFVDHVLFRVAVTLVIICACYGSHHHNVLSINDCFGVLRCNGGV